MINIHCIKNKGNLNHALSKQSDFQTVRAQGFMNAAFHLVAAAPAAGAKILTERHLRCADGARDARIALTFERVTRQAKAIKIRLDIMLSPSGQRIDLDPLTVLFEKSEAGAIMAMMTLAPGKQRRKPHRGQRERLRFPEIAAGIGIGGP